MTVFLSTLNQMAFLVLLIVIGYVLVRCHAVPGSGAGLLSKLENAVFVPALVMGTFIQNFTIQRMSTAGKYLLCGLAVILLTIPVAVILARVCTKDPYIRNLYTYGLAFSNFGFMGNAVVAALFPDIFMEYLIFVLPFWVLIYVWGVPFLLIPSEAGKKGLKDRLRPLVNPMFAGMVVGMVVGLLDLPVPAFLNSAITSLGSCMSPVAMLLTGMKIAQIDLRVTLKDRSVYGVSVLRLLAVPAAALACLTLVPMDYGLALCMVCALSMPLGLNTIVVPGAYRKDTSVAAGMALVSHLLSCVTIPAVFLLFEWVVK